MRVLGIDPGVATTGYAVLEKASVLRIIEAGVIRTEKEKPLSERLFLIYNALSEIIKKHHPESMALEDIFFAKNRKTALLIGAAKGVILLSAGRFNLPVAEYTPLVIKQSVCGFGRAEKRQVQEMIKRLLGLAEIIPSDDATDAVACALCHLQSGWKRCIES
ncbi:MAG: crossover junction endodeoxyribonuclease RuvC [bacterium]